MFGLIGDAFNLAGRVVGTVTGVIVGVPLLTIATALGITVSMVSEAKDAGCETYEEIKEFFDL